MKIIVTGLSHKTAPISVRDTVVINRDILPQALEKLRSSGYLRESCIVSTCNRTEIYGVTENGPDIEKNSNLIFNTIFPNAEDKYGNYLFYYENEKAVDHLFNVASGLDSLVIGEPQVLGQLKEAYQAAMENKNTSSILNRLFHRAFSVSKQVRTETGINEGPVSVGYAAVELAKKIYGDLEAHRVLIIGAGETGALTARQFHDRGVRKILIANRTLDKAEKLAFDIGGSAIRFEEIDTYLKSADIVVTAIGAESFILNNANVEPAMASRKNNPLFFIDLGAPRDISPEISKIYNVFLYDIDDLKSIVEQNLKSRQSEVEKAGKLIKAEVISYFEWYRTIDILPMIKKLQDRFEEIRVKEIESNLNNLNGIERKKIDLLTKSIVKKLLKFPILKLKENASTQKGIFFAESLGKIFDINDDDSNEKDEKN